MGVYSASIEALLSVQTGKHHGHLFGPILLFIGDVRRGLEGIVFSHIIREGNVVADEWARMDSRKVDFFTTLAYPPNDIKEYICGR